jgi:hypothetical protein
MLGSSCALTSQAIAMRGLRLLHGTLMAPPSSHARATATSAPRGTNGM